MPDQRYGATIAADGTATITVRPSGAGWIVRQVSNELAAGSAVSVPGEAVCEMRKNGAFITALIAQGDAAVEPPAVQLQPADELTVEWANGSPGNVCSVFVIYDLAG
jgi:hypothetical protein